MSSLACNPHHSPSSPSTKQASNDYGRQQCRSEAAHVVMVIPRIPCWMAAPPGGPRIFPYDPCQAAAAAVPHTFPFPTPFAPHAPPKPPSRLSHVPQALLHPLVAIQLANLAWSVWR
ncbi:hypothetical protein BaRGS_00012511 [Batillaria attramentaria]|uniref:Uncharacterized protein n=1 Tax=Batillaria attramentaria TaxID=370345 RepID=A0ABD0L9V5_9CAEN